MSEGTKWFFLTCGSSTTSAKLINIFKDSWSCWSSLESTKLINIFLRLLKVFCRRFRNIFWDFWNTPEVSEGPKVQTKAKSSLKMHIEYLYPNYCAEAFARCRNSFGAVILLHASKYCKISYVCSRNWPIRRKKSSCSLDF